LQAEVIIAPGVGRAVDITAKALPSALKSGGIEIYRAAISGEPEIKMSVMFSTEI